MTVLDLLLGRRLANREGAEQKIGWVAGVPAMGLDGLGSASYGPEAALTILAPLGALSLAWIGWVIAPIVVLLAILYLSYRQTIVAYPSNGGAYTVARENLGPGASLLAAAALMVDYILNVAVGISAGVGALVSSVPALHAWTLPLCLAVLALVAVANLRGTREAGLLFALPTYLFVFSFLALIGVAAKVAHPEIKSLFALPIFLQGMNPLLAGLVTTGLVLAMATITALFFFCIDMFVGWVVRLLFAGPGAV